MAQTITRADWEKPGTVILSKGRAGNARVYRVDTPEGAFVIKDFRKSPWWIRWTWGRWMIAHEYDLMSRLQDLPGIPRKLFKVDAYAFGMELLPGTTLGDINQQNIETANRRRRNETDETVRILPALYFRKLERLVAAMHRRGVTHLDTRNAKNVLVLPGDEPALIDFQSGIILHRRLPRFVKRLLRLADLSSVYKHYFRFYDGVIDTVYTGENAFPKNRARLFLAHLRIRNLWMLKGYSFLQKRQKKDFEKMIIQHYNPQSEGGH